jgi:hypothetical protein
MSHGEIHIEIDLKPTCGMCGTALTCPHCAARALGAITSAAKKKSSAINGRLGGRPPGPDAEAVKALVRERGLTRQRAYQIVKALKAGPLRTAP